MELTERIRVERLPDEESLATSEQLPGLVAQGRGVVEAPEIARDIATKLIETRCEHNGGPSLLTPWGAWVRV